MVFWPLHEFLFSTVCSLMLHNTAVYWLAVWAGWQPPAQKSPRWCYASGLLLLDVGKNIMIEDMDEMSLRGSKMCWLWSWTEFLNGPDTAIKWTLGVYFCSLVQVTLEAAGICHTKQICHVYPSTRNIFVKAELFYQLFANSCFPREITGQIH